MRIFTRPASESRAIEQGVALLMKSYEKMPPHIAADERDEPGDCFVVVLRPNDTWLNVVRGLRALLGQRTAAVKRSA